MCTSSFAAENEYYEGIFMSLLDLESGKPLPSNVTCDVNPYQHRPSDLPADLWYFNLEVKKDREYGFWVETGEACEIFSNSTINGLITTLQFYEGWAPHEQKTNWVMQEYKITEKCNNNSKDRRTLCRVFLADENKSPFGPQITNVNVKISLNLGPMTESAPELLGKNIKNDTDPFLETNSETDCILRGDFFELNDLVDQGSCSSSSENSSCLTMTSDEYFDSIALLQELEDDVKNQEMKDSNVKFNLSATIRSKEVVIRPAPLVSLTNNIECEPFGEDTSKTENLNKSSSNGVNATSSNSCENTSKEGKESVSRTKRRKIIKYLWFLAF